MDKELILAAENGQLSEVKNLLKKGANPNAMGPNSGALHVAAFNGHSEIVALLLEKNADTNVQDKQGYYPLQLAASKGHLAICNQLIKAAADLEAKTFAGGTALHVAAASDFGPVVSALLKAGSNIEALDNEGNSPLATAAALGRHNIVKALLKAGANIESENKGKERPLLKALRNLYNKRLDNWISEGSNGGVPVAYKLIKGCFIYEKAGKAKILSLKDQRYCASQSWGPSGHLQYLDAFDTIMVLLKAGAQVDAPDVDQQTALHIACHCGDGKIIKELAKSVQEVNLQNKEQISPLHFVAGSGRLDGLEAFLKCFEHVDVNVVDSYGWTPLHYLADIGGDLKMAELLLAKGANKEAKSSKDRGSGTPVGVTPKMVALHWRDNEMAAALE